MAVVQKNPNKASIQLGGDNEVEIVVAVHVTRGDTESANWATETDCSVDSSTKFYPNRIVAVCQPLALHLDLRQVGYAVSVQIGKHKARTFVAHGICDGENVA